MLRKVVLKILGTWLLLVAQYAVSQSPKEDYIFVDIEQSVTQRGVSCIVQDHLGFIWMGTNGAGLNKYDGVNFTTYKHDYYNPKSLNSSMIYVVYMDSSNRLWVGTESGLNIYNRDLDI